MLQTEGLSRQAVWAEEEMHRAASLQHLAIDLERLLDSGSIDWNNRLRTIRRAKALVAAYQNLDLSRDSGPRSCAQDLSDIAGGLVEIFGHTVGAFVLSLELQGATRPLRSVRHQDGQRAMGAANSGFTLLFEALLMTMISAMPVKAVARMVGEHDTRLWRVVHHYVAQGRARSDASDVTQIAIDETAARRGHDYITLFVDIDRARVLFATEGRDAETVAAFADDLTAHGGDPEAIDEVCIDMSPAFIKGVAGSLPNAAITFDKFHAVKLINDAVDQVRRAEQKGQSLLRGTRYIWLRNPANLSDRQRKTLESLPTHHLKTARAYQIRLAFQELYEQNAGTGGLVLEALVFLGHA